MHRIIALFFWIVISPKFLYSNEIKLLFAGDIMAHDVNISMPNYQRIYDAIRSHLSEHHLNFANFESVISPSITPQGYPRFSVRATYAQAAIEAGFNVFSLANNHSGDHDRTGIQHSMRSWRQLKSTYPWLQYSGLREPAEPLQFHSFHANGLRIGYLALTEFINWQETGNIGQDQVNIVNHRSESLVQELLHLVAKAKEDNDLVIIAYHGGAEYVRQIESAKFAFFKKLIDAGADIIWGAHPHVLQPWGRYKHGVIINSAGNLISAQTWRLQADQAGLEQAFRGDTLLYSVHVTKDKITDKWQITQLSTIPVSNYRHPQHRMILLNLDNIEQYDFLSPDWRRFYAQRLQALMPYRNPENFDIA
jgi:poly-gamma-glutamate capsule biosynthesis protein CapA/YwtB (metallophosphatase superfamily)